jgi:spore coat polysaccharide biosynthesis predicted glycosyltransferase SpsG
MGLGYLSYGRAGRIGNMGRIMRTAPNFFFRVDRGPAIGTGHWARCQVLGDAVRAQGAELAFDETSTSPSSFLGDAMSRGAQEGDWVVLDSYGVDESWEMEARAAGFRVLTIDDSPKRHYSSDVLLDPNLSEQGVHRWMGVVAEHTQVWAGADYLLLRGEFFEAAVGSFSLWGRAAERVPHILVSMGGADPPGMALRVVQALTFLKEGSLGLGPLGGAAQMLGAVTDFRTTVLGGAMNARAAELQAAVAALPGGKYLSSSTNVAQLMAEADLCIGAGGITIWERAYMGLPSLVATLAENQREAVDYFQRLGAHLALGWHEDLEPVGLASAIERALADPVGLRAMAVKAKALVGEPGFVRDPLGHLSRL